METLWSTALWRQFGAAIDMLDNALVACPSSLWRQRLWSDPPDHPQPPYGEFWYVTYHTLFWLDLYLSDSIEGVTPPAPFTVAEFDADRVPPERPYTKEELRAYLAYARQKGRTILVALTDEQARHPFEFPWDKGQGRAISFVELQLYNLRHVQEHAAQLSLFLGQHGIPDADLDWVMRANGEPGSH